MSRSIIYAVHKSAVMSSLNAIAYILSKIYEYITIIESRREAGISDVSPLSGISGLPV